MKQRVEETQVNAVTSLRASDESDEVSEACHVAPPSDVRHAPKDTPADPPVMCSVRVLATQ